MAIKRGINRSNRPFYNMAEFLCDYETDVASLPTSCGPGSEAKVVENGNLYILNNQRQWVLQPAAGSGGSSSGSSSEDDITILGEASASDSDIIVL